MILLALQSTLAAILLLLIPAAKADSESLDLHFEKIKSYGSLTSFCINNLSVLECKIGIGEWKPDVLGKIKSLSVQCYDSCPADTFGFVRSSQGDRDYPEINTKDFDGLAPSRGVEFRLYPLTIAILRYEGCTGCSLVKETPREVYVKYKGKTVELPMLGYGVFYLPTLARKLMLDAAGVKQGIKVNLLFVKMHEERMVSASSIGEYGKMMKILNYADIK